MLAATPAPITASTEIVTSMGNEIIPLYLLTSDVTTTVTSAPNSSKPTPRIASGASGPENTMAENEIWNMMTSTPRTAPMLRAGHNFDILPASSSISENGSRSFAGSISEFGPGYRPLQKNQPQLAPNRLCRLYLEALFAATLTRMSANFKHALAAVPSLGQPPANNKLLLPKIGVGPVHHTDPQVSVPDNQEDVETAGDGDEGVPAAVVKNRNHKADHYYQAGECSQ